MPPEGVPLRNYKWCLFAAESDGTHRGARGRGRILDTPGLLVILIVLGISGCGGHGAPSARTPQARPAAPGGPAQVGTQPTSTRTSSGSAASGTASPASHSDCQSLLVDELQTILRNQDLTEVTTYDTDKAGVTACNLQEGITDVGGVVVSHNAADLFEQGKINDPKLPARSAFQSVSVGDDAYYLALGDGNQQSVTARFGTTMIAVQTVGMNESIDALVDAVKYAHDRLG
jgi:hypothetical protein